MLIYVDSHRSWSICFRKHPRELLLCFRVLFGLLPRHRILLFPVSILTHML